MRSQIKTKVENFLPCQDLNQCFLEQKASMLPISHTGPLKTYFYLNSFCYTKLMCQNCICVSCNDVLISGNFWSTLFNAHGSFPQTLVKKLLISVSNPLSSFNMHPSKQPLLFLLFLGRDFVPRKQTVLGFLCNKLPYLEPYLLPYHEQARAQG